MATVVESSSVHAEERPEKRSAARHLPLLLLLPLLAATLWCAGQLGLQLVFPPVPPIQAVTTADYSQWTYEQFNALNPRLATLLAHEQGVEAAQIHIVALPTVTPTDTPQRIVGITTATISPAFTSSPSPMATASPTVSSTAAPTQTASPTLTNTASQTPPLTSTVTRTLAPNRTRTPSPTLTAAASPLNALFSYAPRSGSAPLTVQFYNRSTGSASWHTWQFGDGHGYSTAANPVYTFSNPGTYVVSLTVYDNANTTDSISAFVIVSPAASATPAPTSTYRTSTTVPINTIVSTSTRTPVVFFVTNTPIAPPTEISPTVAPSTLTPPPAASAVLPTNTPTSTPTAASTALPSADLGVALIVSDPSPAEGATIAYTVDIANNGAATASIVQVTLNLPSEVTFVLASPIQGTYSSQSGVWSVGTLPAGVSTSLIVYVTVNTQTAGLLVETSASVLDAATADPLLANNIDSASFTSTAPTSHADLRLTMNVSNPSPFVGGVLTYSLTAFNAGPNPATAIEVTDLLPTGLSFQSWTGVGAYDPTSGLWAIGTLGPGGSATLNLRAVVSPGTEGVTIVNNAGVTALAQADPNGSNNSASAAVTVQSRGIQLIKTVNDTTAIVGQEISFTIRVSNNMSISATGIIVEDVLPPEFTLLSSSSNQGTFSGSTWNPGEIPPGATAQLQLQVRVEAAAAGRTIRNVASVITLDQPDSNPGNNSDYEDVFVPTTDLAVSKRASSAWIAEQGYVTYTIDVFNNSTNDAADVRVTDRLPNSLRFDSAATTQGSYAPATGEWDVGTLPAGRSARLTIVAQVNAPAGTLITNTAVVSLPDGGDSNPANDSSSASINVFSADLRLTKTVNDPTPIVGQVITYTVQVLNTMQIAATGVVVEDILPVGLLYAPSNPYTANHGTYDLSTGLWTIPSLAPNATAQLNIRVVVEDTASSRIVTNTASIISGDQPDSNPANDSASVDISVPPENADLLLTKTVSEPTLGEGQLITYVVTVRNMGPSRATDVLIADHFPASLAVESITPSGTTTYDLASGIWTVGTLANGATQTLAITATINSGTIGTVITNTASVTSLTQTDPDPGNNTASIDIYIPGTDLSLSKTVDNSIAYEGSLVTYALTVVNNGFDDTSSVQVIDVLPIGMRYVSDDSGGQYNPVTGLWMVGDLASGASASLNIVAQVEAGTLGGAIDNHAYISYFALPDLNTSNNSDNAVVNVVAEAVDSSDTSVSDSGDISVEDEIN